MTVMQNDLQRHPVEALGGARDMAHKAVQLVTRAARVNLTAEDDDSHSNLGWNDELGAMRRSASFMNQLAMGRRFPTTRE